MALRIPFARSAVLVLVLGLNTASAQPFNFDRLDSRSGLPHNLIHSVVQDQDGFIWIGTSAGLARFDGISFTVYSHASDDAGTISSNAVRTLVVSGDGTVWIGTPNGLERYDRSESRFTQVDNLDDAVVSLSATNHSVWALTAHNDLFRVADQSASITPLLVATTIASVASDSNIAWATTIATAGESASLLRYDQTSQQFERVREFPREESAPMVVQDAAGLVWLRNLTAPETSCTPTPPRCLPAGQSKTEGPVASDPSGRLWIGSTSGILVATAEDTFSTFIDPSPGAWLSNVPQAIVADRSGGVWIGTLSGLYHYDPNSRPFTNIEIASAPGRQDGAAMAVLSDQNGTMWVGALGRGLLRVNAVSGETARTNIGESAFAWALHEDRHGTVWAGFAQDGLCGYHADRSPTCLETPAAMISADRNGQMWLGGTSILLFDPENQAVRASFPWPSARPPIEGTLLADSANSVWVGAGGLYHCDDNGNCERPADELQTELGFDKVSVYALVDGPEPYLWLGTTSGLARYNKADHTIQTYFDDKTMAGRIAYSMLREGNQLWLATNRGLVRFLIGPDSFRIFDADDKPGFPEYNRRSAFRAADGTMYFGHLDGVTMFVPSEIRENKLRPSTVITGVSRLGSSGPVALPMRDGQAVDLTFRDRMVRFEFAAPAFTHADENRFRYRLYGVDDAWVDAGSDRFAVFASLPAGSYTFEVQGSNNDGLWSEAAASLMLHVAPPFWNRWWFRVLALLAVASLLAAAHRYRVRHLVHIEQVRTRIATDLHDEVGSKLAALALSSETLSRRGELTSNQRLRLDEMSATARRTVDDLRDIVWLASPRFDSLGDLVEKMRTAADTLLAEVPHTFECINPESIEKLSLQQRRHLFLLFKEILRNVARHANASAASILLDCRNHRLRLTVTDTGDGFDTSATREATGLASLQSRAMGLGGSLTIDTSPGHGTTVSLDAPLGRMAGSRDGRRLTRFLRS